MNFFKSILLDDPDPPKSHNSDQPGPNSPLKPPHQDQEGTAADGWSFGGLIKTLATRSESVIETYRKDLEEFGSGLKKESEIIREAASRAVKDLPASLEAGTSAAQGVLDGVLKSTAEIISKETQAFGSDGEPETPETNRGLNSGRYSWFESQVSAVQSDPNTFCEEPEDVEEYKKWKLTFDLDEKKGEIEDMVGENGNLEGVYERVVPSVVDHETFWCRYFYRVVKLKQQESVRANLVKRAISADEDDDLSWDVDDDDVVVAKDGNGSKVKSGAEVKEVKSEVNRDELRKQLSVEDDGDEDLSWDIEDDDDDNNVPVKSKS
ncbi:PREDICTED: BSD domain-containing protein 1-like [Erythranthe guttata]|uniref:BSD domain-containing protein 1-like n=1 Tax=Erythranthe guttata TaxID=4155 RepID=UPI00064DF285|nr:PREDICTED: BSD domain-containing protein 1-like [Erythranthe guttata]|eukprot:XP_012847914.1 PREDICTED: BSD domain-containing protein 1-like [Erythranthe guttata]